MLSLARWFRRSLQAAKVRRLTRNLSGRLRLQVERLEDRCVPSTTYTVNSLADVDAGGLSTSGTLRHVISLANAKHTGTALAPDLIQFSTSGGTIGVSFGNGGALALAANEVAVIDATTATGYSGTPIISLDGTFAGVGANGLTISGGSSTVKGLAIVNFAGNGIQLDTNGQDSILSSYIGITTAGVVAANGGNGILIEGTSDNTIGSTTAIGSMTGLGGNVLSGNGGNGISITGVSSSGNQVIGNFIGTDPTGTLGLGNAGDGIMLTTGANTNTIGGTTGQQRNVISSNGGNGVLLNAGAQNNTVAGNFIGTDVTGTVALGNSLDGVQLVNANNNVIGNTNPVSGVTYYNDNLISVGNQPVQFFEGIRNADSAGQYLISGQTAAPLPTESMGGFLFEGTIAGVGTSYAVNYPNASTTSAYGPDNESNGNIGIVGSYSSASTPGVNSNGFLFQGTTADLTNSSNYRTIDEPGAAYNFVHSTMGGLAVGNYDSQQSPAGHAFIYSIAQSSFLTDIVFPGAVSNTAYGIWYNGGTSYTICGGYGLDAVSNFANQDLPIGQAYMVDYDSATGVFSNWASFSYPSGVNFLTHFEGISSVEKGVYTLVADSVQIGSTNAIQGSWVTVRRNADGSFGSGVWVNLNNTGSTTVSSANSVYGNQVVGVVLGVTPTIPFQATVNVGFQLSNVISGNGGNGIDISGASNNQVAMNYVGTDVTGSVDLGNGGNGILMTAGAASNMIGGEATGGNNPTGDEGNGVPVFVIPPQGNLISGNGGDGVLINDLATQNQLSGNFIGTTASGDAALGNTLDGVNIDNAPGNSLIGCTFQQDPFVFYNVIDSNGGNGLQVTDSDDTTFQANFLGLGADNSTPLGNALDGALINGTSANMQFGGVIPLGNVDCANGRNGVEIAGTAAGGTYFNTFCGIPAFIDTADGNTLDGFLVTSSGGNNKIVTTIISGNGGNGVHISGDAAGVQVEDAIIGLNTNGSGPIPNGANGVLIDGNAHDNLIGGFQPSVAFHNTISSNGGNGIAIVGNASANTVFSSFVGTNVLGTAALGNAGAGIFVAGSAQGTIINGDGLDQQNLISANLGGGIQLTGQSQGSQVIGNFIGTDISGRLPLGNHGNGLTIVSSDNQIGGSAAGDGNTIAFNTQAGAVVDSGTGNGILGSSIFSNASSGILLVADGNLNQPAPVLTGAYQPASTSVQISGTLTAAAATTYTVQLFTSVSTSVGQAQTLLGSLTITTNANGFVPFVFGATLPANTGTSFTATATDPASNTSSVSEAISLAGNANNLFVASAYGLLLSRIPDAGAAVWINELNGGASPTRVVLGIERSTEYLTDQVVALYSRYLGRAPDATGETHWLNVLEQGGTFEQVSEGMVSSPEYYQDHDSTNQGYVLGLFNQVLGRSPSTGELNAWVSALNAGESRMDVAVSFLTSMEYQTDLVQSDYNLYLARPADFTGLASWVNALQAGSTDQAVSAGILGAAEGFAKWS